MKNTFFAATLMLCLLALAACGGANNASSSSGSSSSSSSSGDSDKPSGPDLSTPAGAVKAVAAAFASGDFAKFDPLWSKTVTQEKKDRMKKDYSEAVTAGGSFWVEYAEADIVTEGDTAKVKTKLFIKPSKDGKTEEESETLRFAKEDGKWMYAG